jgi:hypothetical protein
MTGRSRCFRATSEAELIHGTGSISPSAGRCTYHRVAKPYQRRDLRAIRTSSAKMASHARVRFATPRAAVSKSSRDLLSQHAVTDW